MTYTKRKAERPASYGPNLRSFPAWASAVIITLVAALVIGEEIVRLARLDPAQSLLGRAASGVLGAFVYFLLYLLIVRASILGWLPVRIQPTDLKLMSALIVVLFVVLRNRSRSSTPESAEVLPI